MGHHKSHVPFPLEATIKTGGAAKWVKVPPIEILTKRSPIVAYLNLSDILGLL